MIDLKKGCTLQAGDIYYYEDNVTPRDVLDSSQSHTYSFRIVRLETPEDVIAIIKESPEWTQKRGFELRFRKMLDDNGKMLFDYLKEVT